MVNLIKKTIRLVVGLLPKSLALPIPRGKLKGKKWIVKSGVLGYYFDTYEPAMTKAFIESVKEGDVVYDIGSHIGYYALLASVLVGESGKVLAFEPLPRNCKYLVKHIKINKCRNIIPIFCAVTDKNGIVAFKENDNPFTGEINVDASSMFVGGTSLDELKPSPNVIRMDVEGAEALVLKGGLGTLKKHHPIILFEAHHPGGLDRLLNECIKILRECGYKKIKLIGKGTGGEKKWFIAK